ncbi:MAG: oxaloacetate decarboxylase [bacterium]|nr:oxaloacetate decarboxylase [bacterium]
MKKIVMRVSILVGILLVAISVIGTVSNRPSSVTVIGGADGPTSVFLAGKDNLQLTILGIVVGTILIAVSLIIKIRSK